MGDYEQLGKAFDGFLKLAIFGLVIGMPLAIYEIAKLVWWLCHHITIHWS